MACFNKAGNFSIGSQSLPWIITIDLGSSIRIVSYKLKVMWGSFAPRNWDMNGVADGHSGWSNEEERSFSLGVTAQVFTLTITTTNSVSPPGVAQLSQIRLFP